MVNSRAKGAAGERELAALFRAEGIEARRGQQFSGGTDSPDVIGPAGIHVECKRVQRLNLSEAIFQAIRDAGRNVASVWHRRNREPWLVTIPVEQLTQFCFRWLEAKGYRVVEK